MAVVAHALIADLPWAACFALGAIVAPTDPVAATTIARRLGVPRRMINVLEGESLVNDASALVLYKIAVGAIGGTAFSVWGAGLEFLGAAAGGVAIGLAVAWVIGQVRRRLDDPPVEITLSLLSGYAAYVPADKVGASGVVAAVTTGIALGWWSPAIASPLVRQQGFALWELLTFLLNALLFVLIGLQLPSILDDLRGETASWLIAAGLAMAGDRDPGADRVDVRDDGRDPHAGPAPEPARAARAVAVPLHQLVGRHARCRLPGGRPGAARETPAAPAARLPHLLRDPRDARRPGPDASGADQDAARPRRRQADKEELKARFAATQAALTRARRAGGAGVDARRHDRAHARPLRLPPPAVEGARGQDRGRGAIEDRSEAYQRIVRSVLEAQRDAVVSLRNEGRISNDVMHRIERELDLEDQRLEI